MFIKKYLKLIIIIILVILSIIGALFYYYYYPSINNNSVDIKDELAVDNPVEEVAVKEPIYYQVDIKGAINKPGVYKVEENKRVIDVIDMAGGLSKIADTSYINLSKKVTDEMVIVIYTKSEITNYSKIIQQRTSVIKKIQEDNRNNNAIINEPIPNTPSNNTPSTNQKININLAVLDQLTTLPGIGPAKATAIIDYRTKNNGFKSIEEIKEVSGIGDSTFDQIKNLITV